MAVRGGGVGGRETRGRFSKKKNREEKKTGLFPPAGAFEGGGEGSGLLSPHWPTSRACADRRAGVCAARHRHPSLDGRPLSVTARVPPRHAVAA